MELKPPLSITEQVNRLKAHGLIIKDCAKVEKILYQINYYRFTGYAIQFRKDPANSDYLEGVDFEKVYKIYLFDEELRDLLRKYIEKVEIYYRTQISYWFSLRKCQDPPHNQHYDEENYYNKRGFHDVMGSFEREKNYYKDSLIVKHHDDKYRSQMPLWVIVELISFSNISKLYNSMYKSEQTAIASFIGISPSTLSNHLHCLSVLRNKCAHAARLYNTELNPPVRFTKQFLQQHPDLKNNSLFAYILVLMKRLPEKSNSNELCADLKKLLQKYKHNIDPKYMGFPKNYNRFLKGADK